MLTDTPESVTLVPIDRIEVLNSRDRNMKVFEEIVENIRSIGLKKPITVTEREGADGAPAFLLVCGEGRLNAFRLLGETHIPALVVNVTDEDAFIMSLAENIARKGHRPLEILADIELLLAREYARRMGIAALGTKETLRGGAFREAKRDAGWRVARAMRARTSGNSRLWRECPIFCVTGIWSMLTERSKDDNDDNIQGTAGRTSEGL